MIRTPIRSYISISKFTTPEVSGLLCRCAMCFNINALSERLLSSWSNVHLLGVPAHHSCMFLKRKKKLGFASFHVILN